MTKDYPLMTSTLHKLALSTFATAPKVSTVDRETCPLYLVLESRSRCLLFHLLMHYEHQGEHQSGLTRSDVTLHLSCWLILANTHVQVLRGSIAGIPVHVEVMDVTADGRKTNPGHRESRSSWILCNHLCYLPSSRASSRMMSSNRDLPSLANRTL